MDASFGMARCGDIAVAGAGIVQQFARWPVQEAGKDRSNADHRLATREATRLRAKAWMLRPLGGVRVGALLKQGVAEDHPRPQDTRFGA